MQCVWRVRLIYPVVTVVPGRQPGEQIAPHEMNKPYAEREPKRSEIDALSGPALLEFGTSWCGHCRAAQPLIAQALAAHPEVRHIKVEDASGKRLGRSFLVKLWPTLVFLKDGKEIGRLVRPKETGAIEKALTQIDG
jgi:thioredoxin